MCFRGNCKYSSIQGISGTFEHGLLEGTVKITGADKYFVTHAKVKQVFHSNKCYGTVVV